MTALNEHPAIVAVLPFHDPLGDHFSHLAAILPALKRIFSAVIIGVTPATGIHHPGNLNLLDADPFFQVIHLPDIPVGDQFTHLYNHAAGTLPPATLLHLCFHDRLEYILQSEHLPAFAMEIRQLQPEQTPMLYHRSPKAWDTHPRNYIDIEKFITRVGCHLFGRELDFAWCHLAITAGRLSAIMPTICAHDLSMLAEIILAILTDVQTREVDWLAWEDPYLSSTNPDQLRIQRESSQVETRKRLNYALPMIEKMVAFTLGPKN